MPQLIKKILNGEFINSSEWNKSSFQPYATVKRSRHGLTDIVELLNHGEEVSSGQ